MIEIRVGKEYSPVYMIENGMPQGSVCSPKHFNRMINDIFEEVGGGISKSLFADDGALWVRGRNQKYLQKKLQAAVDTVEQSENRWGFKLSVAKTQVICFAKCHKEISIKLYGEMLNKLKSFVSGECCLMKSLPGGSTLKGQKISVKMLITS